MFFRTATIRIGWLLGYAEHEKSDRSFTDALMKEIKHLSRQEYDDTYSEARPKNS